MDWSRYVSLNEVFADVRPEDITPEGRAALSLSNMIDDVSLLLFRYRMDHSLTQRQLADQLGMTQAMVSSYETGSRNISLKTLSQIAARIGYDVSLTFTPADAAMSDKPVPVAEIPDRFDDFVFAA